MVKGETGGALKVDGQFRQFLARPHRDQLVERALRAGRHPRLHHQPGADVDRIEPGAHCVVAGDLLADTAVLYRRTAIDPHLFRQRSEEHTSELQSLMRISSAVSCLKKK